MTKENFKECVICKLSIDIDIDHYLILTENRGIKNVSKCYYHTNCFREKFLIQNQMKQSLGMLNQLTNKTQEILS